MKETIERLWNEYLLDECAAIHTDEEGKLMKKAVELQEQANALLNKDQKDVMEKYVDALYDIETLFVKKAFLKGCQFAVSFLLEAGDFKK